MTFNIQIYQTAFWVVIGVFVFMLAVACIIGLSLAARVMSARMKNTTRRADGRLEGGELPAGAFRKHKKLAVIALSPTAALLMLSLLRDTRHNVLNEDTDNVRPSADKLSPLKRAACWMVWYRSERKMA